MNPRFLLPHSLKTVGWILLIPSVLYGIYIHIVGFEFDEVMKTSVFAIWRDPFLSSDLSDNFFKVIENGILDEILTICIILGGIFVGFAKAKDEDEFIGKIRTESLIWAIYLNSIIFLFATIFVYDMPYFNVLIFNAFTPILFFVIRFHFLLHQSKKELRYEE